MANKSGAEYPKEEDSPLLEKSLRELPGVLSRILLPGKQIYSAFGPIAQIERLIAQKEGKVAYPHIAVWAPDFSRNRESYNKIATGSVGRFGVNIGYYPDNENPIAEHKAALYPISTEVEIQFSTRNLKELWQFVNRWYSSDHKVQFTLKSQAAEFDIKVQLGDAVSTPSPEDISNEGITYKAGANATLWTYAGYFYSVPLIRTIELQAAAVDSVTHQRFISGEALTDMLDGFAVTIEP